MKERPILFSGPMVRAILDGRKTQTRRVIKPQPVPMGVSSYGGTRQGWNWKRETLNRSWNDDDKDPYRKTCLATKALSGHCPYGQPGDRLWVRETWGRIHPGALSKLDPDPKSTFWRIAYRADGETVPSMEEHGEKWKPSIFMPEFASRITLEIESVRVDRVQEITEEDAKAEGVEFMRFHPDSDETLSSRDLFEILWDSINLERGFGWESNPWVWVITFRRIK